MCSCSVVENKNRLFKQFGGMFETFDTFSKTVDKYTADHGCGSNIKVHENRRYCFLVYYCSHQKYRTRSGLKEPFPYSWYECCECQDGVLSRLETILFLWNCVPLHKKARRTCKPCFMYFASIKGTGCVLKLVKRGSSQGITAS